eukprot:176450_1
MSSGSTELEHIPISKELLGKLHHRKLMNGERNNAHQEAIIQALGGIDEILQHFFTSNVILDQQQLNSIHHIITNTPHKTQQMAQRPQLQEDKAHTTMPTLTYSFKDEDSLLFTIFGQENGTKILHLLSGKIIKFKWIFLFWVGFDIIAFVLLGFSVLSLNDFANYVWSNFVLFLAIYIIGCILYANKVAMKLLLRQFVFWFKIVYLIQFLVTDAAISHLHGSSPYFLFANVIFHSALLFSVMIFDAINTTKSTKLIISTFAVAFFACRVLELMVTAFSANQSYIYDRAIVTIDVPYIDKLRLSIVDICFNSGEVLVMFLFKQLLSIIRKPNKALVITTKPFIEYQNNKETVP